VFALGVAASTLASAPGFSAAPTAWHAVISALASSSMFVFWLFTRALFDDTFEPSARHAGVWGLLAGVGALQCAVFVPQHSPTADVVGVFLGVMPVVWAILAIAHSIATWREDLVERRRRFRTVVVAATSIYTVGQLVAALLSGVEMRTVVESPANATGIAALTLFIAWRMLQVRAGELFMPPARESKPVAATPSPEVPNARQVATLETLMTVQRVYREPSLTIASLALRMGLPEHRLRRLINQGLGHRHFSAFINAYRIADAKRALRDPTQADVPVLAIAMDVGFQSIGPFNRAFKASTRVTPTEFRRQPMPQPAVKSGGAVAEIETA